MLIAWLASKHRFAGMIKHSAEGNSSFHIYGWFHLEHNSIPSWFTSTSFSRLVRAQFADCITFLATLKIFFRFLQTIMFSPFRTCFSFIMSGHVSFLMIHLFAIFPSQCAPAGSAEQSNSTFLVSWPAHNLLIAWLASRYRHSTFLQTIVFLPVSFCLSSNVSDNTVSLAWWITYKALDRA